MAIVELVWVALGLVGAGSVVRPLSLPSGKSNKNRLRVCRVVDVPLREVSGICLRRSRNGRMFLISVGDRVAKIAWFSQPLARPSLTAKATVHLPTDF